MWIYIVIIAAAVLACSSYSRQKEYPKSDTPPYLMREEQQLVREEKQWSVDEVDAKAIEKKVIEIISEQMGADKSEITRETSFIKVTSEQTEKVEDILEKGRETTHALSEEFRQKAEAEFQKISIEMKEILSPEQYARWENDFKYRRRGPGRNGPGRPGPERFGPGRPGSGRFGSERRERRGYEPMRPEQSQPNSAPE